jgi:agmatinase
LSADETRSEGKRAQQREASLSNTGWEREVAHALATGLEAAPSVIDRQISTFSRGELPHFAGINTFLKAPYVEDVHRVGDFDIAVMGVPFDGGTTYRPGTRFGPQGIRKISALYTPYYFEMGVDLRESVTIADIGDVFVIPANIEKAFDQISRAMSHVFRSGAFPIVMGGDHSIGYPTVRGIAPHVDGNIGIIHFDRHVDTQEKDLDERMHTCPWFHATNIANAKAKNLVQLGIGGWQVPRPARWASTRPSTWRSRLRWRIPSRSTSALTSTVSTPGSSPAPDGPSRAACCRVRPCRWCGAWRPKLHSAVWSW